MLHQNKKGDFSHQFQDHQPPSKNPSHSFPSRFGGDSLSPKWLSYIETFIRPLVREEVERKFESHFNLPETREEVVGAGSGMVKLNLCFLNNIPSTIFSNDDIEAENGETLQIALYDATNNCNDIVRTTPLSSALIEFVVLDGEFGSGHREEEIHWNNNVGDFNKSLITQRLGERPLLVGNHKTIRLENGVAFINNLTCTTNSFRSKTKKIRLGARIIDSEILEKYPRIGEAVSNPFRVMDHRGKANKKPHPPRGEDKVYRLEGIRKDGEYHKRLSSKAIETVDDFVKAHVRDHCSLRKLLGNKVSEKKWKAMVNHALEYIVGNPNFGISQNLMKIEDMEGEAINKNFNIPHGGFLQFQDYYNNNFLVEDYSPWLHGEASTSSSFNHEVDFQGAWNKLVPQPK